MSDLLLTLKNLCCERDDRVLFSALNAEVKSGEIIQIAGANGTGKTSLLRIIAGLSDAFEGELEWRGEPTRSYDFYASLLYLGHHPGVKASLTPLENLNWYFGLNGDKSENGCSFSDARASSSFEDKLLSALADLGLSGYEDVPCSQMSAGQQRRVALARLFCSEAPLWLLDEPFTAIDVKGVQALEQLMVSHAQRGGAILFTTHQQSTIEQVRVLDLERYRGEIEGELQ